MPSTRDLFINKLKAVKKWDVVIIGGGASGLGIALDAASRGFSTLLLEQYDFAKGTSSKSTKLLHGGVRYLQQGNVKLVKEALYERGLLQKNARHLFTKQEFIIPSYNWWGAYFYTIGLKIYDLLARKFSLGSSTLLTKKTTIKNIPSLKKEGLQGGVSYFDGQFDDARLAINLAQTAAQYEAVLLNYMKVDGLLFDGNGVANGVKIEDVETGERYQVHCKVIINATGIFTDKILKLQNPKHKKTVVPSQGIHLVVAKKFLKSEKAIMIPKTTDGRVLFIIPWHQKILMGTTDTLIKKPSIEPIALNEEIDFILNTAKEYLTEAPTRADVLSVFCGLRPLAKPKKNETSTKEVSRSHKIIVSDSIVSIVGGKWTTYRKMAQDVVDLLTQQFDFPDVKSNTAGIEIFGNVSVKEKEHKNHLYIYGNQQKAMRTLENSEAGLESLLHPSYPFTIGQVHWSVTHEFARTVEDVLARRLRLLFLDAKAAKEATPLVAATMAQLLKKDNSWIAQQVASFNSLAANYILNQVDE